MYELYYFPGNANLAPHILLEECGAPYRLVLVDRTRGEHKGDAYRALNPHGRIPTLVDEGLVVYEAAAICSYLGDRHPEALLAPAVGEPARAHFYQWLAFLSNTVQPELMAYHYPGQRTRDAGGAVAVRQAAEDRLDEHFEQLDAHLAGRDYLLGERYSSCDAYLLMLAHWGRKLARPPGARPNLQRSLEVVASRPAVRRAFSSEGLEPPRL